jgi:hypothetical protein
MSETIIAWFMAKMIPVHSLSSHAEIERRARVVFELEGQPCGRELDHWLRAEAEFLETFQLDQWLPAPAKITAAPPALA